MKLTAESQWFCFAHGVAPLIELLQTFLATELFLGLLRLLLVIGVTIKYIITGGM